MSHLLQDLRYALRVFAKNPGFAGVAVLVLALGIGANAAVFSLINAMLLKPLAGSGTRDMLGLYSYDRTKPDSYRTFSHPSYVDIREHKQVFRHVMAHTLALVGITEGDTTRRSFSGIVSDNYFETLGVSLAQGRTFTPEEERPNSHLPVVILSHAYWKKLGGGSDALGRTVRVNGRDYSVIGIAPGGFTGTTALISPELWFPLGSYDVLINDVFQDGGSANLTRRDNHALMLVARLQPGLTAENVTPALDALAASLERAYPAEHKDQSLKVQRMARLGISTNPSDDGPAGMATAALLGMSSIVLLIACLNLANMMLARGTARRREMAIRLALGGGRGRIVRQLLTEGLTLAVLGGAGGLIVAIWATRLLVASVEPLMPIPMLYSATPDLRVLAATFFFCVVSTVFFALGPAWKLTRADVLPDLKNQPVGDRPGRFGGRFAARNVLVVGQLALSLVLLVAGGLFVRGAWKASTADPGYRLDGGLLASLDPSLAGYDEARGRQIYRAVLERVRSAPGVQSAGLASIVAFGEFNEGRKVRRVGSNADTAKTVDATYNITSTDYFKAVGVPVLRGRDFTAAEEQSAGGAPVALIDEPLARQLFGDENPIGQQIIFEARAPADKPEALEVIGVAGGIRHDLFDRVPGPHVYVPAGRNYRMNMNLHVRIAPGTNEAAMLAALRTQLRAVDDRLPVVALKTLRDHRDNSVAVWLVQVAGQLFTSFGLLALGLAVVGVYGVKSYVVSRRTREIGVRMALGATRGDVLRLVLRESLGLTLTGLVLGLVLAGLVARALSSLLFEVSALDPVIFIAAPLVLAAAALVACYIPARKATRILPLEALRSE